MKPTPLFLAGEYVETTKTDEVLNPWDNQLVGLVCLAENDQLETATAAAVNAAAGFFRLPRHEKSKICRRVAAGIESAAEELAALITRESGKPIHYARGEVSRAVITFNLAADEALRFIGEALPLDISKAGEGLVGNGHRVPRGSVAAISPFNFPLNLVAHKIAPALAVGCPVILKPAPQTPLTALRLANILHDAGVPTGAVSVLPMSNETAERMVRDDRMGVLSFTGSAKVGWHLKSISGHKQVLLELGGNAPAIVHEDADLDDAAKKLATASFAAAGQVCIKAQRLLVHRAIYDEFQVKLLAETEKLGVGDPANPDTVVGPLIDEKSADRILEWVAEARAAGAKMLCGGTREGNVVWPILLEDTPPHLKCSNEEIFGPVTTLQPYDSIDEAITIANNTRYGLQAGIFTFDVRVIDRAAAGLEYGGIIINDSPMIRVDNFPYGGTKDSGLGREGVRYAMEEFTQWKVIIRRQ